MTPQDFIEFANVITGMAALKGRELSKPAVHAYWLAMEDWELADFKAAAKRLMRTCKFMPEPYDFEQMRKQAAEVTTGEAWELARETARNMRGGVAFSDRGVTSGDPRVDAAVRAIGGYSQIAMCSNEWLHRRAEAFAEAFEVAADAAESREALPRLAAERSALLPGPGGSTWRPSLPAPRSEPQHVSASFDWGRPAHEPAKPRHSEAVLKGVLWQLLAAGTELPDILRTLEPYGIGAERVRAWCVEAQAAPKTDTPTPEPA